jgi:hypothetical protein
LVGADGGVYAFGDAQFYGSLGGQELNAPIVGMAATSDGGGYWLVGADGGVFTFGDAPFHGSLGGTVLNATVIGIAPTPGGSGYFLASNDGGVFTFGDAVFRGSAGGDIPPSPVTAIAATPDAGGYWLLAPDAWSYSFANPAAPYKLGYSSAVVAAAASQVGGDPDIDEGAFCNPYGPCEEWCSLFATWVWEQAGIPIPRYPFTGDVYSWAAERGNVLFPGWVPAPGDAVLYGTGPQNPATSVHIGIIVQAWPDGSIVTVEGDAGPAQSGQLNVVINGPYLVSDSSSYNGFPIYAIVQPSGF